MKKNLRKILDFGYGLIPGSSVFQSKEIENLRGRLNTLQGNEENKDYDLKKNHFALIDGIVSLSGLAGGLDSALNKIPVMPFALFGFYVGIKEILNYGNKKNIQNLKESINNLEAEMIDDHTKKNQILNSYFGDYQNSIEK
jgi:hypothetical protein